MLRLAVTLAFLLAAPVRADVADAVNRHILPGTSAFAAAAAELDRAAAASCDPAALRAPFDAAWDAWLGIAHLRLGPAEVDGRSLAIAYWPDPKGQGLRAQIDLLRGDPARLEPAAFAQQSVAARGLTGLERLLFQQADVPADPCPLIRATTRDLAGMATAIKDGWSDGYANLVLTAGDPGNTAFLSATEARQALYTQLDTGLAFLIDQRLGRPMGTPDRPRPERAEARPSGRAARNLILSITALRTLAAALVPEATETLASLDRAGAAATRITDPTFADVATPTGRFRLEVVQTELAAARAAAVTEIAGRLGVGVGFNSADGD